MGGLGSFASGRRDKEGYTGDTLYVVNQQTISHLRTTDRWEVNPLRGRSVGGPAQRVYRCRARWYHSGQETLHSQRETRGSPPRHTYVTTVRTGMQGPCCGYVRCSVIPSLPPNPEKADKTQRCQPEHSDTPKDPLIPARRVSQSWRCRARWAWYHESGFLGWH